MSSCEECTLLKAEISLLKNQIKSLEDRLSTDSGNSNLPPSLDLKRSRRPKKKKKGSGRKAGGQPGHTGHHRRMSDSPDEVIDVAFPASCDCGGCVLPLSASPVVHQKIEIPPITPFITEYRLHKGLCQSCHREVKASLPLGVGVDLLGPNAKAIISCLTGFFKNSRRETQKILQDIFGLDISLGLISATEGRVSYKCKEMYDRLCDDLSYKAKLHIDETSNNFKGDKGWSWIFAGDDISVLKWSDSRAMKVLSGMFPHYEGVVISDRYGAYNFFDKDKRQICWAHLLRDFEKYANSQFGCVSILGKQLKTHANLPPDKF